MGRQVLGRATKQERRSTRACFGRLRDQQVLPLTLRKYTYAFDHLFAFIRDFDSILPNTHLQLDRAAAAYKEFLWEPFSVKMIFAFAGLV